ncbi:MAG TPA: molybdate ABC transporter substrate-binding protein [Myxococcaceae bacterium]|nr:molybdate ABC transporter substrate-binding protein [Myxococcaceae bacterium]
MRARGLVLFSLAGLLLVGWPAQGGDGVRPEETALTVFAAASLRDAFGALGTAFERAHPGVQVRFNFGGSQELRTQIEQGAPADVFASADNRHMDAARAEGLVEAPTLLATNTPVMVVPSDNPGKVRGLADLPRAKRVVIGAPEVPIGAYTLQILERARARLGADFPERVLARVVSRELNVRQVLTKVVLGEADAGLVYRTDARSAGDRVGVVEIPSEVNVVAQYPIAVVTRAPHPELARQWIALVTGAEGQAVLARAGFGSRATASRK